MVSNITYNHTTNGEIQNQTTTYGWEGNTKVTETVNNTYIDPLGNGIYKPDVVTTTRTQINQSSYARSTKFNYDSQGHLSNTINDPSFVKADEQFVRDELIEPLKKLNKDFIEPRIELLKKVAAPAKPQQAAGDKESSKQPATRPESK